MISYNPQGLSPKEVEENRSRYGENIITPQEEHGAWKLFAEKFRDPIIRILLVAAVVSLSVGAVHGDFTESIGIICAIILATSVSFWFEWDAERKFRSLNQVNDDVEVKVVREGVIRSVPRRDIVWGDVVIVETGDVVPADGVLVEAVQVKVNESTLTGESQTDKTADETSLDPEATYPSNMLLRGTTLLDGYARMVVTAVGDHSEAGRVTEQATVRNDEPTPLDRQLNRLAKVVGRVGIGVAVTIFCVMMFKSLFWGDLLSRPWFEILQQMLRVTMISLAIIVMAVPEGLPMSITISLAMSMRRMLKTNNLVRKMHACETMGAVTVICTDKTGTLTENRMTVQEMVRYDTLSLREFGEQLAVNSTAFLSEEGDTLGNPTEGALLSWLKKKGEDYEKLREGAEIVDRLTFSTERKYMATIFRCGEHGHQVLTVKGAPEIVARMCDEETRRQVERDAVEFQRHAMRTLAVAWCITDRTDCAEAIVDATMKMAALAAIADPVRGEVPQAVAETLSAGIAIKIVTGDTMVTAREIARQIGLWDDRRDTERNAMTGVEFAEASDEELLERIGDLKILSRARPMDKQRLVRLLQQRGEVVAVTGDGTNDAPALNFANVGLSMGSGTSVAKDASDITLLDDSFSSIVTAVMWGRSLYRNIQRFVLFQLTVNFVAIMVCLVGTLFDTDMPLTVVQILWVNIIMDTFAAMAMASLPPSEEVMQDRPRSRKAFIISREMAWTIFFGGMVMVGVLLGMLFGWTASEEGLSDRALTLFFTTFVFFQFWNMFNAKAFATHHSTFRHLAGHREFFMILVLIAVGQFFIVEWGGEVFRTVALSAKDWALVVGGTALLAPGGDLLRRILRR